MSELRTFSQSSPLSILIVDDHPLVCQGLSGLLKLEPDFAVCGICPTGQDAIEKVRRLTPDIVLLDLCLPDIHGMEVIRRIKAARPDQIIIVITMSDEKIYAERTLEAGAHAYIMKSEAASRIVNVIRKVATGRIHAGKGVIDRMLQRVSNGFTSPTTLMRSLTDRETEIFVGLGQGRTVRQIAEHLSLSVKTVESHVARMRSKLVVDSLHALIILAVHWTQASFSHSGR